VHTIEQESQKFLGILLAVSGKLGSNATYGAFEFGWGNDTISVLPRLV